MKKVSISWVRVLLSLSLGLVMVGSIAANLQGQGITINPIVIDIALAPGEVHTEILEIGNLSDEDVGIRISAHDLTMDETGSFVVLEPGTSSSSLTDWLSLPMEDLVVKGGETEHFSISIIRPEEDASNQARWGCLVIETTEVIGTVESEGMSLGIKVRFVVGILQNDPALTEKKGSVTAMNVGVVEPEEEGARTVAVSATFANNCPNILKAHVSFEVRDMTGATIATYQISGGRTVLPGYKKPFTVRFPADTWMPGQYIALAIIDYGGETLAGGQWGFEIPEEE